MNELIDTYLSDPETWYRVADAFIGGIAELLGAVVAGWMFNRLERWLRRRAPRHRADG
jgi:ABC-type branched-subunit amino acid transport system permease subunit